MRLNEIFSYEDDEERRIQARRKRDTYGAPLHPSKANTFVAKLLDKHDGNPKAALAELVDEIDDYQRSRGKNGPMMTLYTAMHQMLLDYVKNPSAFQRFMQKVVKTPPDKL